MGSPARPGGSLGASPVGSPRVTVAIPTWNGSRFIREAIDSVLKQSFSDFELIVVDDCSDDDTFTLVSQFDDPRIRVERNPVRLGLVGNWNRCLDEAVGDYITIFHQDDVMAADNLSKKVAILDAHPSVAFVHSNVRQIDADGSSISDSWYAPPAPGDGRVHEGREYFARLFRGENLVCCPTVLLRRDAIVKHGGFDAQLPFTADWEMWMRLCQFYDLAYIDERLVSYRRHADAETERFHGTRGLEQCFLAKHLILQKHGELAEDNWRQVLTSQYADEAERRAIDAVLNRRSTEVEEMLTLSKSFRAYAPGDERESSERLARLLRCTFERTLETIGPELQALRSHCDRLEASQQALQQRCAELEGVVRAMQASGSWRITAPVRFVYRLVTGRPA